MPTGAITRRANTFTRIFTAILDKSSDTIHNVCDMRIIKRTMLREFGRRHPDATEPLARWYRIARRAHWKNLADVRMDFSHADMVSVASGKPVTVFNVAGNKYRLITAIHYNRQIVYTLRVMTHQEYSRAKWKEQL